MFKTIPFRYLVSPSNEFHVIFDETSAATVLAQTNTDTEIYKYSFTKHSLLRRNLPLRRRNLPIQI